MTLLVYATLHYLIGTLPRESDNPIPHHPIFTGSDTLYREWLNRSLSPAVAWRLSQDPKAPRINSTDGELRRYLRDQYNVYWFKLKHSLTNSIREPFYFNANTITVDSLQMLGLSLKQALAVVKYREKCGGFKSEEQFYNLRVVSHIKEGLKGYVRVTQTKKSGEIVDTSKPNGRRRDTLFQFNANTITVDSLQMLGLSHKQALAVVKYREKCGGFKSEEQFYNLRVVSHIKESLKGYVRVTQTEKIGQIVDASKPNGKTKRDTLFQFNANTITVDSLQMLGLSHKQALAVVKYREKCGGFKSEEQFYNLRVVSHIKERLKGYVRVDTKTESKEQ